MTDFTNKKNGNILWPILTLILFVSIPVIHVTTKNKKSKNSAFDLYQQNETSSSQNTVSPDKNSEIVPAKKRISEIELPQSKPDFKNINIPPGTNYTFNWKSECDIYMESSCGDIFIFKAGKNNQYKRKCSPEKMWTSNCSETVSITLTLE